MGELNLKQPEKKNLLKRLKARMQKNTRDIIEFSNEDIENLNFIMRKGGVQEFPAYAIINNKYATCIRVHNFNEELEDFWILKYLDLEGVYVDLDIDTEDRNIIKKGINRTIAIEETKLEKPRSATSERDAWNEIRAQIETYDEIKSGNVPMNSFSLNFIIYSKSMEGLENLKETVEKYMAEDNIEGHISLNNVIEDLKLTKFKNNNEIVATGKFIKTMFPFHYQDINDPTGFYYGETNTGGSVVIDHTVRDSSLLRLAYDIAIFGKKGSGKSALAKSILQKEAIMGHRQFIIDPENEYSPYAKAYNGKIFDAQKDGFINPLEYRSDIDEADFQTHLDNLKNFFGIISSLDENELLLLIDFIEIYYKKVGIDGKTDTSKWTPEDFPLFEDVYKTHDLLIKNSELSKFRAHDDKSLSNINHLLKSLCTKYSKYFNNYTSIDISNEQIVVYNMKNIENLSSNIKAALIQLFMQGPIEREISRNRRYNDKLENKEDYRFCRIHFDEAHSFLNDDNFEFVKWTGNMVNRGRKYEAGFSFVWLNINNVIPDYKTKSSAILEGILAETVYRYFGFQDEVSGDRIEEKFRGILSKSDIASLPTKKVGNFILSMPNKKIYFEHFLLDEELELFKTGNRK